MDGKVNEKTNNFGKIRLHSSKMIYLYAKYINYSFLINFSPDFSIILTVFGLFMKNIESPIDNFKNKRIIIYPNLNSPDRSVKYESGLLVPVPPEIIDDRL